MTDNNRFHIKPVPYVAVTGLLFLGFLALFRFVVFRDAAQEPNRWTYIVGTIGFSAVCALAGAFIGCAIFEVLKAVKSGHVEPRDVIIGSAGIILALTAICIVSAWIPSVAGVIEIILWTVLIVGAGIEWIRSNTRETGTQHKADA